MPAEQNNLKFDGQDLLFEGEIITFTSPEEPCIFVLKEDETCLRRTQVLYYLGYI